MTELSSVSSHFCFKNFLAYTNFAHICPPENLTSSGENDFIIIFPKIKVKSDINSGFVTQMT